MATYELSGRTLFFLGLALAIGGGVLFAFGFTLGANRTASENGAPVAAVDNETTPRASATPSAAEVDPANGAGVATGSANIPAESLGSDAAPARNAVQQVTMPRALSPEEASLVARAGSLFAIQVDSFLEMSECKALVDDLQQRGYPAYGLQVRDASRVLHQVLVGPYANYEQAHQASMDFRREEDHLHAAAVRVRSGPVQGGPAQNGAGNGGSGAGAGNLAGASTGEAQGSSSSSPS